MRRRVPGLFVDEVDVRSTNIHEVRQRPHVAVHAGALQRNRTRPAPRQRDERLAVAVARFRLGHESPQRVYAVGAARAKIVSCGELAAEDLLLVASHCSPLLQLCCTTAASDVASAAMQGYGQATVVDTLIRVPRRSNAMICRFFVMAGILTLAACKTLESKLDAACSRLSILQFASGPKRSMGDLLGAKKKVDYIFLIREIDDAAKRSIVQLVFD